MERKAQRFWTANPRGESVHDAQEVLQANELVRDLPVPEKNRCPCCGFDTAEVRCPHCGGVRSAGKYRVVRLLGQSPHARTYLVLGQDDQPAVLKELSFATVPSAAVLDAFSREGELLQRIQHPQVPRYQASFQEGSGINTRLYLVEEFIRGDSLQQLAQQTKLTEDEAIALARQVLKVLQHLHGMSPPVIHRDVKPSNLLRRADGSAVLVDFGAARDLVKGATFNATLVGTFGYMPLEQLGGTVNPSCDLYALGATLIHVISGKPPWEMLKNGTELDFVPHVKVSPRFLRFLQKLVARPAERFQTATEALAALDGNSAAKNSSRRAWAVAIAVVAVVSIAALAGGMVFQFVKESAPPSQVDASKPPIVEVIPNPPNPPIPPDPIPLKDPEPNRHHTQMIQQEHQAIPDSP
jgi:serine/threonine-protein kinase